MYPLRAAARSIRHLSRASTINSLSTLHSAFAYRSALEPSVHHAVLRRAMASAVAKRLEGKTIVITGASSGIGYSTAKEFARSSPKNLKLIVTARRVDRLEQLAKEIKEEVGDGVKVLPVKLDVANPEEVKNFVPSLPAEFQDIHVLVNNA